MYSIAQVTDLHLDHRLEKELGKDTRRNLLAVLRDIRNRRINEIVLTGDLAEDSAIDWLFEELDAQKSQYSYIFGNHDTRERYPGSVNKEGFYYYQRDIENIQCLFLDSADSFVDEQQLHWLIERIEERQGPAIIFVHHPILDCGTLFMDYQYPLKNRFQFQEILRKKNRDFFVFCGHYHMEHEQIQENIHQYVTPSTYYQIRGDTKDLQEDKVSIGYRIIEISETLKTHVIRMA